MRAYRRWLLIGASFCMASMATAIEVPLRYVAKEQRAPSFFSASCNWKTAPPGADWKLPKFNSTLPLFAMITVGDEERLIALDKGAAGDHFYNRLYADTNGNKDLTDEKAVESEAPQEGLPPSYAMAMFSGVEMKSKMGGEEQPCSIRLQVYSPQADQLSKSLTDEQLTQMVHGMLMTSGDYEGDLKLDGRTIHIALADRNMDGKFGGFTEPKVMNRSETVKFYYPAGGDELYLGEEDKFEYYDRQTLPETLVIGKTAYRFELDSAKKKVTLTPIESGLGELTLPGDFERMTLFTESPPRAVVMYRPEREVRVPAGQYRILDYMMLRKDEQGDAWQLTAMGSPNLDPVKVGEKAATVKVGEPLLMKTDATMSGSSPGLIKTILGGGGSSAMLEFSVEGQGGEWINSLSRVSGEKTKIPMDKRNVAMPKAPHYKVTTAEGELVTQGDFEYG